MVLSIIGFLYLLVVVSAIFTIISDKRDPVKALSWIMLMILLPVVGFIIYIIFGRNYRKRKIFSRKIESDNRSLAKIVARQLYTVNSPLSDNLHEVKHHVDTITLLLNNNHAPITYGNDVKILTNGRETFDSIIEALKGAQSSIHLEYYIFLNQKIGNTIADILMERSRAGIDVRVIFDDVGSWQLPKSFINKLKQAGVKIYPFMQVMFPLFTSKINYRNHRKIIVVDGRIGFTGGINIADKYIEGLPKLGCWRDTHLRIEGKAAHSLQTVFINDWFFITGEKLGESKYYPKLQVVSDVAMQIAYSGPDSDWASIMQAYFSAITKARKHIYITTPYFLPNGPILTAVKVAALSGIDVRLLIPGKSDSVVVYWATRSYISELIAAGVKIYLYNKGFIHAKLLMIDGEFCSVGSANMDVRSFDDNFEVSALIYNRRVTEELEEQFMRDLGVSESVNPLSWDERSRVHWFKEGTARLLSPLL